MAYSVIDAHLPQDHIGDIDNHMKGSGLEDDEGKGDVVMPDVTDDSSEEGENDEEEVRQVREGFIVDEDEEEEDLEEEAPFKRKRRRRHRVATEDETLEEDDLALLAETAGGAFKRKTRIARLRHRRSDSCPTTSSSKQPAIIESSKDNILS